MPLIHDGVLVNLQRIRPGGRKRFLPGGKVKGCYSPFGYIADGEPLHICEGWATGATIHESTAAAVAYAMNAGNPLAVGQHLQRRYPDAVLIVADERRPPDTWQPEAHRHDGRRPGRWCLRSSLRRRP
ncbi:DNA primase TraC [compost metagenome]